MKPVISLVVCTLGRTAQLERLLVSLRAQTFGDFEIIVVDQNPEGHLAAIIDKFSDLPLRRVASAKGLSRARNVGIAQSTGAIIGFPDDDCWYDADVLRKVLTIFEMSPDIGVLTGRTLDERGAESLSKFQNHSGPVNRSNCFVTGSSSSIFARRAAACDVGGFNEQLGVGAATPFQSGEETDFVLKCIAAGHAAYFDREHTVRHDQVATRTERVKAYSLGFGRVVRLHDLGPVFITRTTSRTLAASCYRLLRGDVEGARQRYAHFAGSVSGYLAKVESG